MEFSEELKNKIYKVVKETRGGSENHQKAPWLKIERQLLVAWHCGEKMIKVEVFSPTLPTQGWFEKPEFVCSQCLYHKTSKMPSFFSSTAMIVASTAAVAGAALGVLFPL